jgi:hypothetical protein
MAFTALVDPRQVGMRSTGSYWGGAGEQINTLTGNLNYTVPLLSPQGRTERAAQRSLAE